MTEIPYHRLRGLAARKIIQALEKDGFQFDHQRGSHQVYRHPDGRRVVVAFHQPGQTFPRKTLKDIFEDAGLDLGGPQAPQAHAQAGSVIPELSRLSIQSPHANTLHPEHPWGAKVVRGCARSIRMVYPE